MTVLSPGKKPKKEKNCISNHDVQSKIPPIVVRAKECKEKPIRIDLKKVKPVSVGVSYESSSGIASSSKSIQSNICKQRRNIPRHSPEKPIISEQQKEDNVGYNSDDEHVPGFLDPSLEKSFANNLRSMKGFEIYPVEGDGACMFRAVALQTFGEQEKHMDVRNQCIEFITKNRDHFSQFIAEDFDEYIERKKLVTTHGNHVELQAITEIYGIPVEIYEYDIKPSILFHPTTIEGNLPSETRPIRLSYHGATHYNAVIDPRYPCRLSNISVNMCSNMHEKVNVANAVKESEANHIEEQMLNDKIKMTDYEKTENDLAAQISKQSYMEYIRVLEESGKNSRKKDNVLPPSSLIKSLKNHSSDLPSTSTKRASSSPHLYKPYRVGDWFGSKMRKNDTHSSLPNIGKEFGLSFYKEQSKLLINKEPVFDPDKPTSTKALFSTPTKQEVVEPTNIRNTKHEDVHVNSVVDSDSPWYQELLLSTACKLAFKN